MLQWYERSRPRAEEQYMQLYIAYNIWYRRVTQSSFDREAIARLKRRYGIWHSYMNGEVMQTLRPVMMDIATLTQDYALAPNKNWSGVIEDDEDWPNLIEFWYTIRCSLFHGSTAMPTDVWQRAVTLAYQSLSIFMQEIIGRISTSITQEEYQQLELLDALITGHASPPEVAVEAYGRLREKFLRSTDIWKVDLAG